MLAGGGVAAYSAVAGGCGGAVTPCAILLWQLAAYDVSVVFLRDVASMKIQ